jgi:large subunit ribosomal protein L7/L12
MISKVTNLQPQIKGLARLLPNISRAYFSATPADGQPIEQTLQKEQEQKDEKNEDLAFKFEREWKKLHDERNASQLQELEKELTENQRKRVQLLAQALLELNTFELRYFSTALREKVFKTSGINPLKLNLDWPTVKQLDIGSWPPANPNWFLQQEAIAKLWPAGQQGFAQLFGGAAFGSGGGAASGAPAGQAAAAPVEEVKEEKVEKLKFDIELSAIDATKKIAIIKEVREITKLGLKEAKEMVEKAPVTLMKDVKKEEAEKLKEKLAAIGCTINLL